MLERLLIVDDDQGMCEMLTEDLQRRGYECVAHSASDRAMASIGSEPFDAVLTDLNMPGMGGIDLCRSIVQSRPDIPVIVMTAFGSMESAIAAIRAGAYDFVTKPFDLDALALTVKRATNHRALQEKVRTLSDALDRTRKFDELIGASETMQKLFNRIEQVADTETSILITGETGSGKELVARAIHKHSRRAAGPFVPVNCPALPDTLLESELFGHARGAFTDARTERKGLFLEADGGTLFLDEIGDLPLPLQSKLLRAVEDRHVRPVGADREIPYDARILAATNTDLRAAVEDGRFREDLFFRINVIPAQVPPLRLRGNDILLLAQHFITQFANRSGKKVTGFTQPVAVKLLAYSWPGNVRELRNVIERAVALTEFDTLVVDDLPKSIQSYAPSALVLSGTGPALLVSLEEVETRYIRHVLKEVGGNKTEAARILHLDRKTLYRKIERQGL